MTNVILTDEQAIMPISDFIILSVAVSEMRRFLQDNYDTGDEIFQSEVFKAAVDYVCRCFPCNETGGAE